MRGEVEKETPKKEMDLDVFLLRHTWHFLYLPKFMLKVIQLHFEEVENHILES